jgi:hypothetical protein
MILLYLNPPYINIVDLKRLDLGIKLFGTYYSTLNAGIDGLSEIKKIIRKSRTFA